LVSEAPLDMFDSGLGGLSVLREIQVALPAESMWYVADSGHAPWGDQPRRFIRERSLAIARFLAGQGAKALVIACNTSTAVSAEDIRDLLARTVWAAPLPS
jgi:glutamate racemase